jgi:hypothetical protein
LRAWQIKQNVFVRSNFARKHRSSFVFLFVSNSVIFPEEDKEEEEEQRIARAIDEGNALAISSSSIVLFDCLVRRRSFVIMDDSFSFIRQLRYLFFFACS